MIKHLLWNSHFLYDIKIYIRKQEFEEKWLKLLYEFLASVFILLYILYNLN